MKNDDQTTLAELKALVASFVDERGWQQYHSPKNLSMSIAMEAAELMEHFQWLTPEEAAQFSADAKKKGEVSDELADILSYILSFCNLYGIDLSTALSDKMKRNAKKYPQAEVKNGVLKLD